MYTKPVRKEILGHIDYMLFWGLYEPGIELFGDLILAVEAWFCLTQAVARKPKQVKVIAASFQFYLYKGWL